MSDYCESCGCRQSDPQRPNLHHYVGCSDAPGGAVLSLKRRGQDGRDAKDDEIESLRTTIEAVEREVALVYDHLTGGKFSKCNTKAQHVIDAAEESQKTWTDELIAEAVEEKNDEIERLRERIKNLGTDLDRKIVTITRQRQRIERLRGELADREKRIHKQCKRIEELEKSLAAMDANQGGKHYITTDQIDALVRTMKHFTLLPATGFTVSMMWQLLAEAGVYCCKGCGGDGAKINKVNYETTESNTCPDCDGHGWVKKEPGNAI